MIHADIQQAVQRWILDGGSDLRLVSDCSLIDYLSTELYEIYEPTTGSDDFRIRLRNWVFSHPVEERQQTLLRLVPFLSFFGPAEFSVLRRQALTTNTVRWLIDAYGVSLAAPDLTAQLTKLIKQCIFIGLTKSGRLHDFCKTNGIVQDNYLQADTFHATGFTQAQLDYVGQFDAIVLIEDFIGSGIQSRDIISLMCVTFPKTRILCVPLLCHFDGIQMGGALESAHTNLTFEPVMSLPEAACLKRASVRGEIPIADEMRDLINALPQEVAGYRSRSPFGFADTGALSIFYFNCPDNVPELVHVHANKAWSPLFPRV